MEVFQLVPQPSSFHPFATWHCTVQEKKNHKSLFINLWVISHQVWPLLSVEPILFFFHTQAISHINVHFHVHLPCTWTMKYSQKLQPGWVRFSRSVRMSSSKRPRFLVKDMRRRVRSFSSKEFQDSTDRDESFRGSDKTTHLDRKTGQHPLLTWLRRHK